MFGLLIPCGFTKNNLIPKYPGNYLSRNNTEDAEDGRSGTEGQGDARFNKWMGTGKGGVGSKGGRCGGVRK